MKKLLLLLGILITVAGVSAQECSDLFFSEYIEGTGNNKGMEIYNPTDEIIPLGNYYVARYSNGNLTYESGGITRLQGFLQAHSTHFLVNGQTVTTETSPACDPALQALAQQVDHDYPAPTYMNGNDAIALFKDPVGNGDVNDFLVVDLFGIIGGGMQSTDEGWASFTGAYVYKNIYEGDVVTGRDSVYIQNYIVPDSYFWIPWSSNHSLVRKSSVKEGVTTNPDTEFVVTMEWDTLAGGADIWDAIGFHNCDCQTTSSKKSEFKDSRLSIYPNPVSDHFQVETYLPFRELILYDASGREVFQESYGQDIRTAIISTGGWPAGLFHLKVRFGDRVEMVKIVVL